MTDSTDRRRSALYIRLSTARQPEKYLTHHDQYLQIED